MAFRLATPPPPPVPSLQCKILPRKGGNLKNLGYHSARLSKSMLVLAADQCLFQQNSAFTFRSFCVSIDQCLSQLSIIVLKDQSLSKQIIACLMRSVLV